MMTRTERSEYNRRYYLRHREGILAKVPLRRDRHREIQTGVRERKRAREHPLKMLKAVDELLPPRSYPPDMRPDIRQDIIVALLDGRITLSKLQNERTRLVQFRSHFYKSNFEQPGFALPILTEAWADSVLPCIEPTQLDNLLNAEDME